MHYISIKWFLFHAIENYYKFLKKKKKRERQILIWNLTHPDSQLASIVNSVVFQM